MRTWLVLGCVVACACNTPEDAPSLQQTVGPRALPGLSSNEQRLFQEGFRDFIEVETASEGLGPLFNAASCAHCHNLGGVGGAGNLRVLRAACREADGEMTEPPGGTLIHLFSTRADVAAANVPFDCDALTTQRRTTNLLGAGLIEAIDDAAIIAEAERQADMPIAGRVAWVDEPDFGVPRVGRFGWKAQHASLHAFAGDAYLNELGITNELFPDENAPAGDQEVLSLIDPTPDPEAAIGAVTNLASFMRFSAPLSPESDHTAGHAVFMQVGCGDCHREHYDTAGDGALAVRARLFSDLLLHDVDTGIDVPQGAATEREFRTPPLWGLGRSAVFLHDGRAGSIDEAITAHGAQAQEARDAYRQLPHDERTDLIAFLRAL